MAIATYADYTTATKDRVVLNFYKTILSRFAGSHAFASASAPVAGATPSTAVACNNATAGAFNVESPVGGEASTEWAMVSHSLTLNAGSMPSFIICDRLSHQGGLSGTVTGAQTSDLPTAALTRYTSGVGVMICLDIYSAVGATASTITATYTNSAGVGGRVTKDVVFGGAGLNSAATRIWMPLQDGDVGVRSVQSVNLIASTLTAGNFGVTLTKPLTFCMSPILGTENFGVNNFNNAIGGSMQFASYLPNCCIELASFAGSSVNLTGVLGFIRK